MNFEDLSPEQQDDIKRQMQESEEFRKEYSEKHKFCPRCGYQGHSTTLVAYPLYSDRKEEYKDENICVCSHCGNSHITHDRISLEEVNKLKND